MTCPRVVIGRDVRLIAEQADGVEIEGAIRLRPGHPLEVVLSAAGGTGAVTRSAVLWSWTMTRMGSGGPMFRGFCRWA